MLQLHANIPNIWGRKLFSKRERGDNLHP